MLNSDSTFWAFVEANAKTDPAKLRLKYHKNQALPFDVELAITQIECRQRFGKKLAETLSRYPQWLFPTVLAGEQSTSDLLASYHASLVSEGETVADLTCGLGIDALHISRKAKAVYAVDIEQIKTEALDYNISHNGLGNIKVINADCRVFLSDDCSVTRVSPLRACGCEDDLRRPKSPPLACGGNERWFDTVFIDPARRADDGSRVFALSQCQPDVVEMLPLLKQRADRLIVKMSPMLDVTQTLRELPGTERIIALGTATECKELIAVVNLNEEPVTPAIEAVTLVPGKDPIKVKFSPSEGEKSDNYRLPKQGDFIYEPYPAVMKMLSIDNLSGHYDVTKLHPNTQLYISEKPVADFPGQMMLIEEVVPYSSKNIKRLKKTYPKISVSTRNFPISADQLRAKLGVSDGGTQRLIAATLADGSQAMIICNVDN